MNQNSVVVAGYKTEKLEASALPTSLQYVPAGRHTVQATVNGKPGEMTIEANPATAAVLDAQLQNLLKAAEEGKASRPFIDFDHEGNAAAAIPKRFFWEDGIRLEVEWTKAGREAIEGRVYSYFSPEMFVDKETGEISGLPEFGPIGGLVNTPAFQTIERIAARYSLNNDKKETMSDANEQLLKERDKQVAKLEAEKSELAAQLTELQNENKELVAAKAELTEERDGLKDKVEAARKEKIENKVDALIEAGRIKKTSKDAFVSAALLHEDDGAAFFDALPDVQVKAKGHAPLTPPAGKGGDDEKPQASGIDRLEASLNKQLSEKGLK